MKQVLFTSLAAAAVLVAPRIAQAQTQFSIGSVLATTTCTNANGQSTCKADDKLAEQDISIAMKDCSTMATGETSCKGTWTKTFVSNGVTYTANIDLSSMTPKSGTTTYSLAYTIGAANDLTLGGVIPAGEVLTDTSLIFSPVTPGKGGKSYSAFLAIGPVGVQSLNAATRSLEHLGSL